MRKGVVTFFDAKSGGGRVQVSHIELKHAIISCATIVKSVEHGIALVYPMSEEPRWPEVGDTVLVGTLKLEREVLSALYWTPSTLPRQYRDVIGPEELKHGRVKRYDEHDGYGFIIPEDGVDDVFMHISRVADKLPNRALRKRAGKPTTLPRKGERVVYVPAKKPDERFEAELWTLDT